MNEASNPAFQNEASDPLLTAQLKAAAFNSQPTDSSPPQIITKPPFEYARRDFAAKIIVGAMVERTRFDNVWYRLGMDGVVHIYAEASGDNLIAIVSVSNAIIYAGKPPTP